MIVLVLIAGVVVAYGAGLLVGGALGLKRGQEIGVETAISQIVSM